MLARNDSRVVFCIPWGDRTVIGTTDTYYDGAARGRARRRRRREPTSSSPANNYFPERQAGARRRAGDLGRRCGRWSSPTATCATASDVSREHHMLERPGLVTIAGGKLTTYRRMAAEVVDRAGKQLGEIPPCTTGERPLPGALGLDGDEGVEALAERAGGATGLDERGGRAPGAHLRRARARGGGARGHGRDRAAQRLEPELPYIVAQVDEAVGARAGAHARRRARAPRAALLRAATRGSAWRRAVARARWRASSGGARRGPPRRSSGTGPSSAETRRFRGQ